MTAARAYRCVGGDIICRGYWMDDAEVQRQADLALTEHDDCLRKGDRLAARMVRTVFLEITDALKAQADWKRSASAPRQTERKAA